MGMALPGGMSVERQRMAFSFYSFHSVIWSRMSVFWLKFCEKELAKCPWMVETGKKLFFGLNLNVLAGEGKLLAANEC
jgi:hypothetical protein